MSYENIQVFIYESPDGLNMEDAEMKKKHGNYTMINVNRICPDLHLLDITSDPNPSNVYSTAAMIDGSRFQYNVLQKSTVTLYFWLQFTDFNDYAQKKSDIADYFSQHAAYYLSTSVHPGRTAKCHLNSISIPKPDFGVHDVQFQVKFDNDLGQWSTSPTSYIESHWSEKNWAYDLELPTKFSRNNKPTWQLHQGSNHVYIPGSNVIKFSDPLKFLSLKITGAGGSIKITNNTTNTSISAKGNDVNGSLVWTNLDLRKADGTPINQESDALDFWLDGGFYNDIDVEGCNVYLDMSFYYAHY